MNLISDYKKTIFYINPNKIVYCLLPSSNCEFTHFGLDKLHPHAGVNRGFFKEDEAGFIKIINSNWDQAGSRFDKIPEFIALNNHFNDVQNWNKSEFANRIIKYITSGNILNNFNPEENRWKTSKFNMRLLKHIINNQISNNSELEKILIERENEINNLFDEIKKNGVLPCKSNNISEGFINNISINLGENDQIFFNHRGHHRLSISKILNLKLIPVKIAVAKNLDILNKFISNNKYEKLN